MKNFSQTEQPLSGDEMVIIRKEKRMGYVFAAIILMFGLLLNLWIILDSDVENKGVLLIIDPLIVFISFFVCRMINRDFNKDLRAGIKTIQEDTVQKKEARYVGEAGSGVLYIPILGDLFPKLWGQEMKNTTVFKLVVGSVRYTVEKETFANVEEGAAVKMHFAPNSKILLKVERV